MTVLDTVAAMQAEAEAVRLAGRRLALVPTMGALHDGHLALVEEARRRADHVTVSIFVNPTQFAPGEDFERYPRTLSADLDALRPLGVDAVFVPETGAMYAPDAHTTVHVAGMGDRLCGAYRAGHFDGVTTIVAKLLLACRPHVAVFGRKDAQQFVILRRMVRDLGFGVEMAGVETVREADGLALSSRNRYLTSEERAQAPVLYRALRGVREAIAQGERDPEALVSHLLRTIGEAPMARVQYAEIVDAETLEPLDRLQSGREALAAVAVYFGQTRLIDNQFIAIE